jgi:hypothetical protein
MKGVIATEEEFKALDPVLQGEYEKGEDDRYYAKIDSSEDGWAFENVQALKRTGETERASRKEWEKKYNELNKRLEGVDPEDVAKIASMKEQIEEMKKWTPDDKVKARIAELEKTYEQKLRESEESKIRDVSTRDARIQRLVVGRQSTDVLVKLGCIDPTLHAHEIELSTKVLDDDKIVVVDSNGDSVPTKIKGRVGDMTLEEFCQGIKERYPQNFKGSGSSGGGSDPTGAGGAGANGQNTKLASLPADERLKAIRRAQHQTLR